MRIFGLEGKILQEYVFRKLWSCCIEEELAGILCCTRVKGLSVAGKHYRKKNFCFINKKKDVNTCP